MRSHLEYGHSVWNPYRIGLISDLERVQKRATKLVKCCKKLSYSDRLRFLEIPTLKFRRTRGDMIEVFKILRGFYDADTIPILLRNHDLRTRGNDLKLLHSRSRLDVRKYSFSSRIVSLWNMLQIRLYISIFIRHLGIETLCTNNKSNNKSNNIKQKG